MSLHLEKAPNALNNLRNKVDKLDVDKLKGVPADLEKSSDIVDNDVVKKDVYDARIEDTMPSTINLATNAVLNA